MKILTVTDARQKLGYWLKRAGRGEEIGVIFGDSIFALRKVPVQAADYMETEYGLTKEEADRAAARILAAARWGPYISVDALAARVAARRKARRRGRDRKAAWIVRRGQVANLSLPVDAIDRVIA